MFQLIYYFVQLLLPLLRVHANTSIIQIEEIFTALQELKRGICSNFFKSFLEYKKMTSYVT